MKTIKLLVLFIIGLLTHAQNLDVALSAKEVVVGEQFQFTVRFEYSGDSDPYVSFEPVNAEVVGDNTNSNNRIESRVTFSGGKAVTRKIYNYVYTLQPVKPGIAHVREIKVDIGGNILKVRTQSIKVLSEARELPDFFLKAEIDKNQVYKGEGFELHYVLYFKTDIRDLEIKKFPAINKFLKRFELSKEDVKVVNFQGEMFKSLLIYKAKLFPEEVGDLSIDPLEISFAYPEYRRQQRDIFGMSMMFSGAAFKTKVLRSNKVEVNVLPLPTDNVPSNFSGLVGDHDFVLNIPKSKILVNDVIEGRLEITGDGALEKMDPPKLLNSDSFEEFEPKSEIVELGNLNVKKVIDYTYIGKKSVEIPERNLKLSIFDPVKRVYVEKSISIPSFEVYGTGSVTPSVANTRVDKVESKENKESVNDNRVIDESVVAPLFSEKKGRLFNLNYLSFVLLIISLFAVFPKISPIKGSVYYPKKMTYKEIHDFLVGYALNDGSLREMIEGQGIEKDSKLYLLDVISSAEKNEYKNSKINIKMNKKHFQNYANKKIINDRINV